MQSVLGEISKLRNGIPIVIDYHNSNRYRLVVRENNGTKTAYYFSTPIYNRTSRKMIDLKFQSNGDAIYLTGSNTNITVFGNVKMENAEGSCVIALPNQCRLVSTQEVHFGDIVLMPSANGVAMKCAIRPNEKSTFVIDAKQSFLNVRANDRCVALMRERFKPFAVFSCIGSGDAAGNIIAPAKIEYQILTDKRYIIAVSATSPLAQYVLFEANLYENKLFQDTTVESMNPSTNNAFGSVGFIGNTSAYGEQWLYSRLDYSKMPELMDKPIHKAVLHMPKLNQSNVELSAYKVSARFCSFGSNWNNKISGNTPVSNSSFHSGYQSLDVTSLLVDQQTKTVVQSEGLVLKPKIKGAGFSVIATGDSCFAPQILEMNYR